MMPVVNLCLLGMFATGYWMVSPSAWLAWWRCVIADAREEMAAADREFMDEVVRRVTPVVLRMVELENAR